MTKSVVEDIVKGGMSMVKARNMGNNLVLLTPKNEEQMEDIIKLNNEWFQSVFEEVESWSEACVAILVWARCYGLPILLWFKDCLSKVVGEVASLVAIDEATLLWENLEFARIQVQCEDVQGC